MEEHTFQSGDSCPDCHQLGLNRKLRPFHINLKEQIVKCESSECMFPYTDDISSDSNADFEEKPLKEMTHNQSDYPDIDKNDDLRFLEELFNANEPVAAAPNFSIADFNFSDFQTSETIPKTTNLNIDTSTSSAATQRKLKIEIQSVETLPNNSIEMESQLQTIASPSRTAAEKDGDDKAEIDIPKARISRYFATLNANKEKWEQERFKKRVRKKPNNSLHRKKICMKKEYVDYSSSTTNSADESSKPLQEVLKLISKK